MRRRALALVLALSTLFLAVPSGALPVVESDEQQDYICIRSKKLPRDYQEICVDFL